MISVRSSVQALGRTWIERQRIPIGITAVTLIIFLAMAVAPASAVPEMESLTVFDASTEMESGGGTIWEQVLNDIAVLENWSIRYRSGPLHEGIRQLNDGEVDLLTAVPNGYAGTPAQFLSQESMVSTWCQIVAHADVTFHSVMDLYGRSVGVMENDFLNPESRRMLKGLALDIKLVEFRSGDELLAALEKQWIDAAAADRFFLAQSNRDVHLTRTSIIFSPMDYHFAALPDHREKLLDVIDYHLRRMKKDPGSSYHRHLESLFGRNENVLLLKYLKIGLAAAGVGLIFAFIHVVALRYRVKSRTAELASKNRALEAELVRRRRAESALRDSENRFRSLFEATTEGIAIHEIVCNADGEPNDYVITDINPAYSRHTGLLRDEVVGCRASAVYATDEPPFLEVFADTALNGTPRQFDTFFEKLQRHFAISVCSPGHGQFATIVEDTTASRKAEATLRASEEKYRQLVENAHDLIVVIQDKMLVFANPKARQVFGYDAEDMNRMAVAEVVHPDDRRAVLDLKRIADEGDSQPRYFSFRAITKRGGVHWLQMNAVPIQWEEKPASLCMLRDITESKMMETRLHQAEKMQAIGTLAAGLAHDFNNILAAIIGHTELCKMKIAPDSDINHNLDQIFSASQRARDLVGQILTFSRQKERDRKPLEIKYCIKEALKLLKATIPSTIDIRAEINDADGIVIADPTQIHQIIMNLCTNAAHAMEDSGGVLEIRLERVDFDHNATGRISALQPGGYMALTISDTGRGMPPETLQRIFEPYFTTKDQGQGTGLGLSMVHGIVESLGGVIKVHSEPGTGSTFEIFLPCSDAPSQSMPEAASDVPGGDERLLLVDDETMVLEMTREILTRLGYQVVDRVSSVEALKAFEAQPDRFDLVVTDQTMPKMNGKTLAARMMAIRPDIPVILCTGFSTGVDEEKALAMGIRAFVKKPILRCELAATVRRVLDASSTEGASASAV